MAKGYYDYTSSERAFIGRCEIEMAEAQRAKAGKLQDGDFVEMFGGDVIAKLSRVDRTQRGQCYYEVVWSRLEHKVVGYGDFTEYSTLRRARRDDLVYRGLIEKK